MSKDTKLNTTEQADLADGNYAIHHGKVRHGLHSHDMQYAPMDEWELRMKRLNPNWSPNRVSLVEVA